MWLTFRWLRVGLLGSLCTGLRCKERRCTWPWPLIAKTVPQAALVTVASFLWSAARTTLSLSQPIIQLDPAAPRNQQTTSHVGLLHTNTVTICIHTIFWNRFTLLEIHLFLKWSPHLSKKAYINIFTKWPQTSNVALVAYEPFSFW